MQHQQLKSGGSITGTPCILVSIVLCHIIFYVVLCALPFILLNILFVLRT
jgi:hypothetical protein